MKIRLTDLPTYYINIEADVERGRRTKDQLSSLGFKDFIRSPGFVAETHERGCGLAHQNILQSKRNDKTPFIVFEDDIEVSLFQDIIEVPDDADAIYLGISKMGIIEDEVVENIQAKKIETHTNLYRIYNMLAAHAILYVNQEYVAGLSDYINIYIENNIAHDIGMAKYMAKHNVYALDTPMFFQSGKFKKFTDTKISDLSGLTLL